MIGYYVNRWMIFYWLHGLLNRLTGGRRLRWVFEGPNGAVLRYGLTVDWGHTDAEVWWWHRQYITALAAPGGHFIPGWRMIECPREIDPAYNSAGAALTDPPDHGEPAPVPPPPDRPRPVPSAAAGHPPDEELDMTETEAVVEKLRDAGRQNASVTLTAQEGGPVYTTLDVLLARHSALVDEVYAARTAEAELRDARRLLLSAVRIEGCEYVTARPGVFRWRGTLCVPGRDRRPVEWESQHASSGAAIADYLDAHFVVTVPDAGPSKIVGDPPPEPAPAPVPPPPPPSDAPDRPDHGLTHRELFVIAAALSYTASNVHDANDALYPDDNPSSEEYVVVTVPDAGPSKIVGDLLLESELPPLVRRFATAAVPSSPPRTVVAAQVIGRYPVVIWDDVEPAEMALLMLAPVGLGHDEVQDEIADHLNGLRADRPGDWNYSDLAARLGVDGWLRMTPVEYCHPNNPSAP